MADLLKVEGFDSESNYDDTNSVVAFVPDEEIIKKPFRNFMLLLYKDSYSYNFDSVMACIRSSDYYAYIEHEPDSGEKKSHFHVILSFDNQTTINAISKRFGIQENYIRVIKNKRSAIRYLTHIDYPDKIQYPKDSVIVSESFGREFNKAFEKLKGETEIIQDIYDFIDSYVLSGHVNYFDITRDLILFVNYNVYDTIYKRYRFEFQDYLKSKCV